MKDRRWRKLREGEDEDDLMTELYDLRYEVIDPAAEVLLASEPIDELPGEDERNTPPIGMFAGRTAMSFRPISDDAGLSTIEFFDLRLLSSSAR